MTTSTSRPLIAVIEPPGEGPWPGLEGLEEHAELVRGDRREHFADAIAAADVLVVTDFRTAMLGELAQRAERLQWVHATSAGVDAVLVPEVTARDLLVTNARGVFDQGIAEYVLGAILAFAKDLRRTFALQAERRWQHRETQLVRGKRLLVVGAGSIGRRIARCARAVGLEVEGIDRAERPGDADFSAVRATEALRERLAVADYVVVSAPLTETTRGMFGAAELAAMKPSAHLINVGRGPIVQTEALLAALESGQIAGAALDVFEEEPLPAEHPLWSQPNVILTAHQAGDFVGWREALSAQFIDFFHRWRAGEAVDNVVQAKRAR